MMWVEWPNSPWRTQPLQRPLKDEVWKGKDGLAGDSRALVLPGVGEGVEVERGKV